MPPRLLLRSGLMLLLLGSICHARSLPGRIEGTRAYSVVEGAPAIIAAEAIAAAGRGHGPAGHLQQLESDSAEPKSAKRCRHGGFRSV